jgi:hypothetical protein
MNEPAKQPHTTLSEALESGPIERIEIELVPRLATSSPGQFRWKLWSGGRLVFVATGAATPAEIAAMIQSTSMITQTTLGVEANDQ